MLAVAQGKVSPAPLLKDARQHHTASLLKDGRVLVVGGRGTDGLSTLASCELFDPKKNKWSTCAPLNVARSHHAATALEDGRLLVIGGTTHESIEGQNRFIALASVEVYEPKKNTWLTVAPMTDARNGHTATLLLDGTVLVVGGAREQRQHLTSVERFDPVANTWKPEKPLDVARWLHAAVRNSEGDVVVVGGRSNAGQQGKGPGVSIADVERFDVKSGSWQVLPPMSEPRQRTAVIAEASDGGIIVVGGQTATSSTNYAETWSPGLAEWKAFENHLSMSLSSHSGTRLPSGDLVVIGGEPPNSVDTTRVQRWLSSSKQWCLAGELFNGRKQHTATLLLDGRVLVVGGTSSGLPERSAELWAPAPGKCEDPPGISMGW
ncbi:MAG: kelch repeat-containing protein [Archangium sp.]|nr:kelch repeat-containing protein [Archangium sp.]MDP3573020.1 kelch repeat-containing protein [Archangium sp.]